MIFTTRNRFPRLRLIWLAYAAPALVVATISLTGSEAVSVYAFVISAYLLIPYLSWGVYLINLTNRCKTSLDTDTERYALFLRPFNKDTLIAEDSWVTPGLISQMHSPLLAPLLNRVLGPKSLERALSRPMRARFGKFVAIGDPADKLPTLGAQKVYCDESHWQSTAIALIKNAMCVIVQCGDTAGLGWELRHIYDTRATGRLFLITEPEPRPEREQMASIGHHPTNWERERFALREAGLRIPDAHPGPGAVICFTDTDDARLLVRHSHDVGILTETIYNHLSRVR